MLTAQESRPSESHQARADRSGFHRRLHVMVVLLGLISCFWGIWTSGREGLSTLLSSYALTMNRLDAADKAVRTAPSNPEVHYARARLLSDLELPGALKDYESAVALRPRDYALWLELGLARDQANDAEGALAAFKESARLAPSYAEPRWQLGNTLFRAGHRDEAFADLRRAAISNPKLLPQAIDLAWAAFRNDAPAVERALQPQTQSAHLALASFFAKHGQASESISQFHLAGALSKDQQRVLVGDLLASQNFAAAFEVWSSAHPAKNNLSIGAIINPGFEEPIALDDHSFGWQVGRNSQAVRITLDTSQPHDGTYSLRIDWSGESDPSTAVISQLVLVEPKTRYRLSFAARTQELLTIGLPLVLVADAGDDKTAVLMKSETLLQGTSEWQDYKTGFTTAETTSAVTISIRRVTCATPQCGAFGHVWFDNFSLVRL